ncbi:MAG: RNA 3'-terminal-phosphate cyclase [Methanocella sp. PtaU1.Bin125]|nr:MAG: RNA 3'-terminal-phosphate cyclase [Methanocella sp. PtaU1.Bin125]
MDLIEIDGSYGEGGGQILRSAIAVSAITGRGVIIRNIRKNRPRPGLGVQHIKSIEMAGRMTGASIEGLAPGSTSITFIPGDIRGGEYSLDLGTAGSISLVLQSVAPIAAFAPSAVTFHVTGGTDVRWSPTVDYFRNVTLHALRSFGLKGELNIESRGFFPVGWGRVTAVIEPSRLRGVAAESPEPPSVRGVSSSSRLPPHVVRRQAEAAQKYLNSLGIEVSGIALDARNDRSTGSSITLFSGFLGGSALGERGLPAEKVGIEAATILANEIESGAAVDPFLCDQLITFMALAEGASVITTGSVTSHAVTNMWVMEQMTNRRFTVEKDRVVYIRSV